MITDRVFIVAGKDNRDDKNRCLLYTSASDGKMANVYDIIRSSVTFDLGRIFYSSLGEVNNVFRQACSGNTGSYMSVATGRRKMLQQLLDNLVKDIGLSLIHI